MPDLPTMTPVTSSNIAAVGHDGDALYVQFTNGTTYRYPGAPAEHHEGLTKTDSPGRYFHHFVKGAHAGDRV